MRSMTVRFSDELARDLEAVARLTGRPVSTIVRAAIGEHIAGQRLEPEFRAALKRLSEEDEERLARFKQPPS